MRPRSERPPLAMIQEADLLSAPMSVDHQFLALKHFQRLRNIVDQHDDNNGATNDNQTYICAAREGLARMTIVLGDYMARYERGGIERECESMIADLVEAGVSIGGSQSTPYQPAFPNPMLVCRDQEILALVQRMDEANIGNATKATHKWRPKENNLPEDQTSCKRGADIDWRPILFRSKSYDDLLHHQRRRYVVKKLVKNRPELVRELSTTNTQTLDRSWPPPATSLNEMIKTSRARAETIESNWEWTPQQMCVVS